MSLGLRQLYKLFKKSHVDSEIIDCPPSINEAGVLQISEVPKPPQTTSRVEQSSSHCILPVELWTQIVSAVYSRRDQLSLCRTSRTLQSLSEPYIYRSIGLSRLGNEPFPMEMCRTLAQAMQNPRLAGLVTSFYIHFDFCKNKKSIYRDRIHMTCTCNRMDDIVGRIVVPLSKLETLSIHCHLCKSDMRHSYLQWLTTRTLKKMHLDCHCYTAACSVPFQIFSSPGIQTVTSLTWMESLTWIELNREPFSDLQLTFIESHSYLPKVTKLSTSYLIAFTPLLRRGAISSLSCDRSDSGLVDILTNCPPDISRLHIGRLDFVISDIIRNPAPYRNLRSMSGITIEASNVSTE